MLLRNSERVSNSMSKPEDIYLVAFRTQPQRCKFTQPE